MACVAMLLTPSYSYPNPQLSKSVWWILLIWTPPLSWVYLISDQTPRPSAAFSWHTRPPLLSLPLRYVPFDRQNVSGEASDDLDTSS